MRLLGTPPAVSRILTASVITAATLGLTAPAEADSPASTPNACPPRAQALGYSDALDKVQRDGVVLGGLSDLDRDRRSGDYVSSVDNHDGDPARLWFLRDLAHPEVSRDPLVLRRPGGAAFTGRNGDFEGLAVLPDGRFVLSSETEPSIRVFGRDGVQRSRVAVPRRLRVAPAGEATANATLEGLTLARHGRRLVASMEGVLSGDVASDGTDTSRRFLVYDGEHARFVQTKEVGYRVQPGFRVAEIQAYGGRLLVLEAAFDPQQGNRIRLYATRPLSSAPDVSGIQNLGNAQGRAVLGKTLVANVTACPTLGASSEEPQANPLMDNYEGMHLGPRHRGVARVTLISDDNFSDTQKTRVLRLSVRLP